MTVASEYLDYDEIPVTDDELSDEFLAMAFDKPCVSPSIQNSTADPTRERYQSQSQGDIATQSAPATNAVHMPAQIPAGEPKATSVVRRMPAQTPPIVGEADAAHEGSPGDRRGGGRADATAAPAAPAPPAADATPTTSKLIWADAQDESDGEVDAETWGVWSIRGPPTPSGGKQARPPAPSGKGGEEGGTRDDGGEGGRQKPRQPAAPPAPPGKVPATGVVRTPAQIPAIGEASSSAARPVARAPASNAQGDGHGQIGVGDARGPPGAWVRPPPGAWNKPNNWHGDRAIGAASSTHGQVPATGVACMPAQIRAVGEASSSARAPPVARAPTGQAQGGGQEQIGAGGAREPPGVWARPPPGVWNKPNKPRTHPAAPPGSWGSRQEEPKRRDQA